MKYMQGKYPVVSKKAIAKDIYDFEILCPEIAKIAQAGQFIQVLSPSYFLRRPISICGIDREKGTLRMVFEIRGKGTEEIATINSGDLIDIIAPLGRGFEVTEGKKAIVIGGGIGTPPMLGCANACGKNVKAIIGFRSASNVILENDFKAICDETIVCTDDGTYGRKGFVTEALEDCIKAEMPDIIYACGPMGMLKGIVNIADKYNIKTQVSLEQRMACGVGACLVCACRLVKDGEEFLGHVCKDGPVFDSKEVKFDG